MLLKFQTFQGTMVSWVPIIQILLLLPVSQHVCAGDAHMLTMANLYRVLTMCQKIIYSLQHYSEAGAFIISF